jgi:hypothetical protein
MSIYSRHVPQSSPSRKGVFIYTNGICCTEAELESVGLAQIKRVLIQHPDVQEPLLEVLGRNELDARRQRAVDLRTHKVSNIIMNRAAHISRENQRQTSHLLQLLAQPLRSELRRHHERLGGRWGIPGDGANVDPTRAGVISMTRQRATARRGFGGGLRVGRSKNSRGTR